MTHQPFPAVRVCLPRESLVHTLHYEACVMNFYGTHWLRSNFLLVCPVCQQTWAILEYLQREDWLLPIPAVCKECPFPPALAGIPGRVPGSLLIDYNSAGCIDWSLLERLPEPLLRREFDLHLAWFTRQESNA